MARMRLLVEVLLVTSSLLYAAFLNGGPYFFYDSLDYLQSGDEIWRNLLWGHTSSFYGLRSIHFSAVIWPFHLATNLWPVIVFHAALIAFVLVQFLSTVFGLEPISRIVVILFVVVTTTVSLYASLLMPDILTGAVILGIYLLAVGDHPSQVTLILFLCVTYGIVSHPSNLLLACIGVVWIFCLARKRIQSFDILVPVVAGIVITVLGNWSIFGKATLTNPNGPPTILARFLADPSGQKYLEVHNYEIGGVRIPRSSDANEILWGDEGIWRDKSKAHRIAITRMQWDVVREIIRNDIVGCLFSVVTNVAAQLGATSDSRIYMANDYVSHVIGGELPELATSYLSSWQASNVNSYPIVRWLRLSVYVVAVAALFPLTLRCDERLRGVILYSVGMVVCNCIVTGILSGPMPRYHERVSWICVFVACAVFINRRQSNRICAEAGVKR